jgi:hypothetical protein
MKLISRRALFWLILTGYAAGSAWWILSVPYNPEQLLRAIPGHAISVSRHDQLAGRWEEVADHPLVLSLIGMFGGKSEEWIELREDEGFKAIINLIGKDDLMLAYVPYMGMYQERTWIFSSWIGGQSQRLRWSHRFLHIPDLRRMEDIGGWPVWTWYSASEEGTFRVTVALVEGMMIGCTAQDPMAIETVIEAYNGLYPSVAMRTDLKPWNKRLFESDYPDRFWFKSIDWPNAERFFGQFNLKDATHVDGSLRFPNPFSLPSIPSSASLDDLASLWRNYAVAACAVGSEAVMATTGQATNDVFINMINKIIQVSEADAVALALFGGDFSGRFKGMKVPTLMAALQLSEGRTPSEFIQQLVDEWNARYQWGLVPVAVPSGTSTIWRIEGTSENIYSGMGPAEQISLTQAGEWMVISSNFKGLLSLMESSEVAGPSDIPDWAERMGDAAADGAIGYLGFDLVRGAEMFRLAITAYSLKLLIDDASGSREFRQRLNEAKAWLEILAKLDHLHLYAGTLDDDLKIDFSAGP